MFKRIFISYLAVLMISFAVLALAFNFTVRQYLINDTIQSLHRVAETLTATGTKPGIPGGSHMRGAFFNLANRVAYADYILFLPDGSILDSSDIESYPPGNQLDNEAFLNMAFGPEKSESLVEKNLVAVVYPVIIAESYSEAALIIYSHPDLLSQLGRSLLGILTIALGAAILVSLTAGALATRVVIGPLQQLKNRADELARRQFTGRLTINTGDELEDLANTFNEMADQLAEYDRVQKEFFQKASHELKTPLMSIQGYAEALKEGVIPPDEKEQSLDIIIKESRRMKALVDEFLYLSKMETLKESYSFEPVILEDSVREAVYAVRSLAFDKGVKVSTTFGSGSSIIDGDPEKIHRLLLNVLGNALRHTRRNVNITIEGPVITVEDDGPGFQPGEIEKIFTSFYRGENGGSGLGLTISRAIVEKHGGAISASDSPDGGAKIKIVFRQ